MYRYTYTHLHTYVYIYVYINAAATKHNSRDEEQRPGLALSILNEH